MRSLGLVLGGLMTLLALAAAVPAQGPSGSTGAGESPDPGNSGGQGDENRRNNSTPPNEPGGPGQGRPGESGKPDQVPGHVEANGSQIDGRYVDFAYDQEAGTLLNYTVGGVAFFQVITFPGPLQGVDVAGARVEIQGANVTLIVTDNPTGLLRVKGTDDALVRLTPTPGVAINQTQDVVHLSADNLTAVVANGTLEGADVVLSEGIFAIRGHAVSLVAHAGSQAQQVIERAVERRDVAARVQLLSNGTAVLVYDEVNVSARALGEGAHRVLVGGNLTEGRAFVVEFAPGLLKAKNFHVKYYDEQMRVLVPAAISEAGSLEDALEALPGEGPEYFVVDTTEGHQVVVSVPSFSVHAFDLVPLSEPAATLAVYGLVAGLVVGALMAGGLVLGRRLPA